MASELFSDEDEDDEESFMDATEISAVECFDVKLNRFKPSSVGQIDSPAASLIAVTLTRTIENEDGRTRQDTFL